VLPFVEPSLDTGTPERLEKAVELHVRKKCAAKQIRFVVLDRDGTLIPDIPEGRKDLSNTDISEISASAIKTLNDLQVPVFLVTNQPGVAKGWITEDDVEKTHIDISNFLQNHNAWIDDFAYCKHHPQAGFVGEIKDLKINCICRKPNPGLVIALAEKYGLDVKDAIVIGDSSADAGLANNLGVPFYKSGFNTATNKSDLGEVVSRLVGETCF
jgi:D-glycero-D-manno-heptose 1,7-bisphosphate phosphatase